MNLPRHAEIWLAPYVRNRMRARYRPRHIRRVWLAVVDHWEPFWNDADLATAQRRVAVWLECWPEIAAGLRDSAGHPPKYSFFYAEEQYRREFLDGLAGMVRAGIADVEVHIHHGGEGRSLFIERMATFCRRLANEHGLLRQQHDRTVFGFVHGDWALDNSYPDGLYCGLNDEISILRDLGCYADFTMPSGNSPTQARMLNTIYWCKDDPERAKSYDRGAPAHIGGGVLQADLLMIPGPFGLRWRERLLPRMETGEIAANDPPTPYRARCWFDLAPRLGEDLFIKLYTHGAKEANAATLLNGGLRDAFTFVAEAASAAGAQAYFVSAWQMYRAIMALCSQQDPVEAATGKPCSHSVLQSEA